MKSKIIILFVLIISILLIGCKNNVTIPENEFTPTPTICVTPVLEKVSIEGAPIITTKFPVIHVEAKNATCMGFSGDKITWVWTKYQETYNEFDISTLPTIKSNELKVLYVKVKNSCGESNIVSLPFIYQEPEPFLAISAVYVDSNENNIVDTNDVVIVSFNKKLDTDSVSVDALKLFDIYNFEIGDLVWNGVVEFFGDRQLKIVFKSTISNLTLGFTKLKVKPDTLRDVDGYYITSEPIIIY